MREGIAILLAAVMAVRPAEACSCSQLPPVCQRDIGKQVVFVGTVTALSPMDATGHLRVQLRVDEAFSQISTTTATILTTRGSADCSVWFEQGQSYLVWANGPNSNELQTSGCQGTTRTSYAQADIQYLREWKAGTAETRIFGAVGRAVMALGSDLRIDGPVAGAAVMAISGQQIWKALTGADGKYEFQKLPAGPYRLVASVPRYGDLPGATTQLSPLGCIQENFWLPQGGFLRGRLLNAQGKPLPNIQVSMEDITNPRSSRFGTSGEDGQFLIAGLREADYILKAFGSAVMRPDGELVIPDLPVYFPGTFTRSEAQPLRPSEQVLEFRSPSQPKPRQIKGAAFFSDGLPAAGALAAIQDRDLMIYPDVVPKVADDGSFTLTGLASRTYVVIASIKRGNIVHKTKPVVVDPGDATTVRVTFSIPSQ